MNDTPYDPLAYENLGASVADAMLARPVVSLNALRRFNGAGVYALYYVGPFPAYQPLAEQNRGGLFQRPVYVGKAVPAGARKGGRSTGAMGTPLFSRLSQHSNSINEAVNLDIADFYCRYLVVADIWIPLGESLLIEITRPLWNLFIDGFGNHDPGAGRVQGRRSLWDTLHPGRRWAERLPSNERSGDELLEVVRKELSGEVVEPLPEDAQAIEAESDEQ